MKITHKRRLLDSQRPCNRWSRWLLVLSSLVIGAAPATGIEGSAVDKALNLYLSHGGISGVQWTELRQQLLLEPETNAEVLQEPLRAEDAKTRRAAIDLLFQLPGGASMDSLLFALASDPSFENRVAALERLAAKSELLEVCRALRDLTPVEKALPSLDHVNESVESLRSAEEVASPAEAEGWPRTVQRWEMEHEDKDSVAKAVQQIIHEAIEGSTVEIEGGVRVLTRPRANTGQKLEVLRLGPHAIRALVELAWSTSPTEWEVARRLLVEIGNGRAVEPLARVIREHPEAHRRRLALMTLMDVSRFSTVASAVVSAARSDSSAEVRSAAAGLVAAMRRELGMEE